MIDLVEKALEMVREDFMNRQGVNGVGMGCKTINEELIRGRWCIVVFVKKKGEFEPKNEIPKIIMMNEKEIETDVIECTFEAL